MSLREGLSPYQSVVLLSDLDALLQEFESPHSRGRLRKLGFELESPSRLAGVRSRLQEAVDRRWLLAYERAHQRYGRGVAAVRDRVCAGCFVTLPTTARPRSTEGGSLNLCESCGRLLYWS